MHTPPLLREICSLPSGERGGVQEAYDLAKRIYESKRHTCGEPLIVYAEKVARLLLPLHPDSAVLIAALLQFAQTQEHLTTIEKHFGGKVAHTISALSVLERGCGRSSSLSAPSVRKMILVLSRDIWVLLIFLHNRRHLLEQAQNHEQKQLHLLARETLDIFAPISARLGMYSLKYTLETLAFTILYPHDAQEIADKLEKVRRKQHSFVTESARSLKRLLLREGQRVEIIGREKHPYSIFRKMHRKGVSKITDLHDLFGLRLLVESVEDCYHVLGIIHRTYRPIIHRMKDYIAFPKPNGYCSLHTTVLGLNVKDTTMPVEIQIRTQEMDTEAEYGIAAHWSYKEGGRERPELQRLWQERMRDLQQISDTGSGEEMSDTLLEAVSDRIYVLTPQGDPLELPKGSTPLDFAFRVHTDIGLRFRAARVNGTIVPIDHVLENGDMVEILKQRDPAPSENWIHLLRTKDGRAKLRSYFREQAQRSGTLKRPLFSDSAPRTVATVQQQRPRRRKEEPLVSIDAQTPLPHRFAQCCKPHVEEGVPIIGFITRTGIINIHKQGCHMLKDANRERCVRASWKEATELAP